MSEWTDELKQEVVEAYLEREPTAENTTEIVKELAEQFEKSANGVRMILVKAQVYVKGTPAKAASGSSTGGESKRINKAEEISKLKTKIEDMGRTVDNDIIDRLTGKAAVYIREILEAVS